MQEKKASTLLMFLLALVSGYSAVAQTSLLPDPPYTIEKTPYGFFNSPTYVATMGMFSTPADEMFDASGHAGADFDTWYAFASYANPVTNLTSPTPPVGFIGAFGYARNFKNVYLGFYFGGTAFAGKFAPNIVEGPLNVDGRNMVFKQITNQNGILSATNNNRFAVLLGLENMGFRLSFATTYNSFSSADIRTNTVIGGTGDDYMYFSRGYGQMVPSLQWGMTKPLFEHGIMPNVNLDFVIARESRETEDYTGQNTREKTLDSYIEPTLTLNLGEYNMHESENGLKIVLDLDYTLSLRFYKYEDYRYENGAFRTLTLSGYRVYISPSVYTYYDYGYTSNTISPSLGISWITEDLGLKASVDLPVNLTTQRFTTVELQNNSFAKKGDETSEFRLTVSPRLLLGAQYRYKKLTFNIGGSFDFGNFVGWSKVDTHVNDSSGVQDNSTITNRTTNWGDIGNSFSAGMTFNFNENFAIDAMTSAGTGQIVSFNIFGSTTDSLTVFHSLMATLKF